MRAQGQADAKGVRKELQGIRQELRQQQHPNTVVVRIMIFTWAVVVFVNIVYPIARIQLIIYSIILALIIGAAVAIGPEVIDKQPNKILNRGE